MDERDWLAERFEEHRSHVRAVAYRMLGSASEADDAVQEACLRPSRAATSSGENRGWSAQVGARDRPMMVLDFTIRHGTIVAIDAIADPDRLAELELAVRDG